jgi:hypothetical protein
MGWACGAYGWGEGVYRVLVGKPEGRRPLERPRRRWVDNIRIDLQELGCGHVDWIGLAQDRDKLVSAVMNLRVPWNAGNFLTSCKPVSCSGSTLHHAVSNTNCSNTNICRKTLYWEICTVCEVWMLKTQRHSAGETLTWGGGGGVFCSQPLVCPTPTCAKLDWRRAYRNVNITWVKKCLYLKLGRVRFLSHPAQSITPTNHPMIRRRLICVANIRFN